MHESEIPKVVVRRLCLGHLVMGLWLNSMDDVGKFDRVLNEKHGDVVSNNVPVALFGVELDGEASNIADSISAAPAALDSGKAQENRSFSRRVGENARARDIFETFLQREFPECCRTSGVHNSFWDAFMIKSMDLEMKVSSCTAIKLKHTYLLTSNLVLEEGRSSLLLGCNSQPIVCVGYFVSKVCRHMLRVFGINHILFHILELLAHGAGAASGAIAW
jgi:hypothetical protein